MARKPKEEKRARRKKGTGTVYRRASDGRWAYEWYVEGTRYISYADTYEEADKAVLQEIAKVEQGTFIPPDKITVGEWLDEWWANTKQESYRANPRYKRKNIIESRIKPAVGHIVLQKLTARQLQALSATWAREDELAPRTIHSYLGLLSLALDSAVKVGIITANPCKAVSLPKISKPKRPALTLDQAQLLMIDLNDHWLDPWVTIAVGTGMRAGELASLKWEDIDFEAKVLHVQRNVSHAGGEYEEGPPKTEAGARDIALPDFVVEVLRKQQHLQKVRRVECGPTWNPRNLVLPRSNGEYRNADVVTVSLKRKLAQAGLPVLPFHSLRHSAVRIMQALGVPLEVIQKIVGHSSIKVTADIYGDVSIGMQQDASKRMSDAFRQAN